MTNIQPTAKVSLPVAAQRSDVDCVALPDARSERDLFIVHKQATASGRVEITQLTAASGYQAALPRRVTNLPAGPHYSFCAGYVLPPRPDAKPDLVAVRMPPSGPSEALVLSAASDYIHVAAQTLLPQRVHGSRFQVAMSDVNQDQYSDLVMIRDPGWQQGAREAVVLSGRSLFSDILADQPLGIEGGDHWDFTTRQQSRSGSHTPVVGVKRDHSGTATTELHVFHPNQSHFLLHTPTGEPMHDASCQFVGLASPSLANPLAFPSGVAVLQWHGDSRPAELHTLSEWQPPELYANVESPSTSARLIEAERALGVAGQGLPALDSTLQGLMANYPLPSRGRYPSSMLRAMGVHHEATRTEQIDALEVMRQGMLDSLATFRTQLSNFFAERDSLKGKISSWAQGVSTRQAAHWAQAQASLDSSAASLALMQRSPTEACREPFAHNALGAQGPLVAAEHKLSEGEQQTLHTQVGLYEQQAEMVRATAQHLLQAARGYVDLFRATTSRGVDDSQLNSLQEAIQALVTHRDRGIQLIREHAPVLRLGVTTASRLAQTASEQSARTAQALREFEDRLTEGDAGHAAEMQGVVSDLEDAYSDDEV